METDNFQEEDGQQSEEEQQTVTTNLEPVEPEVNPKLKNDKKLKRVVKILDKIIEETSTDNMDLTTTNQMQYTAALLITNKITPP